MTNEMFEALAAYEPIFEMVKSRQYQPYPGRATLQVMLSAVREVRPNYRPNLGCSSCVRSLVLETAGMYFTEKAARGAAKTPVEGETPSVPRETPTQKKKARKSKINEE